jgi:hypothetical protein
MLLPGASEEQSPFYSYFNLFKNKKKLQARGASPLGSREDSLFLLPGASEEQQEIWRVFNIKDPIPAQARIAEGSKIKKRGCS